MTQFLANAKSSLLELETQIEIAGALAHITSQETEGLTDQSSEVGRLLDDMINHFRQSIDPLLASQTRDLSPVGCL